MRYVTAAAPDAATTTTTVPPGQPPWCYCTTWTHFVAFCCIQLTRYWMNMITFKRTRIESVQCCLYLSSFSKKIFDVQFWWPWTRAVQGHPRLMVIMPNGSPLVVSSITPLCLTLYLSRHSRDLMWKLWDLDVGWFKVIQGQRWWCQSTAHRWLLLTPISYLSPFWHVWRVILMTLN